MGTKPTKRYAKLCAETHKRAMLTNDAEMLWADFAGVASALIRRGMLRPSWGSVIGQMVDEGVPKDA